MTQDPNAGAPLLALSGIGKTYVTSVLRDATLAVRGGEVLALTGENGAGKSTLSKIICGLEQATDGTMLLDGAPYLPASRSAAEALGIRMVMQELNLIPTLSIAENLYLNQLPHRFGWIARDRLARDARAQLDKVGLTGIDPWTPVGELGWSSPWRPVTGSAASGAGRGWRPCAGSSPESAGSGASSTLPASAVVRSSSA